MHWRNSNLQSQFPNISPEKYSAMFTLYNSSDVDLTIYWNIPNMKRHGHHYIIGVNLGIVQNPFQGQVTASKGNSGRTMFEQTAKERATLLSSLTKNKILKDESPIKLMVKANDAVHHDFEEEGLLGVPVDIILKNCSWNKTATYTLELMSWTENKVAQSQKRHVANRTCCATVFTGTLHPDEANTLEAQAIFQLPGVYDVNRWKLTVETSNYKDEHPESTGYFVQWPSLPQIVTIIN
ncbi:hypothetical protein CLU79DRAFT_335245 [Phycomyces nitens]|nr:hypothetical protein CLU79DRAFT_335245 [Phycomyces nitens]